MPSPHERDYFEIPGYTPPTEPHVYAPMGRIHLRVGQIVRYHYYEQQTPHYQLGVVTRSLGPYPATGHRHYEISFTAAAQLPLFSEENTSQQRHG
jgi:hypothetical protein